MRSRRAPGALACLVALGGLIASASLAAAPASAAAKDLGFSAIRKGLELFAEPWEPCEPLPSG